MNDLAKQQLDAEAKLTQFLTNLRKTPIERRTLDFLDQKEIEVQDFDTTHKLIEELEIKNTSHEHFTSNRYKNITRITRLISATLKKISDEIQPQERIPKRLQELNKLIMSLLADINNSLSKDQLRAKLFETRFKSYTSTWQIMIHCFLVT